MNKKILALLSFFIVIAAMSSASAFDFKDISNALFNDPNDNVEVGGMNFTVPNGFKEIQNQSVANELLGNPFIDVNISSKTFAKGNDVLIISVSSSDVSANDDFAKDAAGDEANKTTINGISGYEFNDTNFQNFAFAKDGKLVIMSASYKQIFNDVVVA